MAMIVRLPVLTKIHQQTNAQMITYAISSTGLCPSELRKMPPKAELRLLSSPQFMRGAALLNVFDCIEMSTAQNASTPTMACFCRLIMKQDSRK